jgi:hypothetical protein
MPPIFPNLSSADQATLITTSLTVSLLMPLVLIYMQHRHDSAMKARRQDRTLKRLRQAIREDVRNELKAAIDELKQGQQQQQLGWSTLRYRNRDWEEQSEYPCSYDYFPTPDEDDEIEEGLLTEGTPGELYID